MEALLTDHHRTLGRIARAANILAWLVLGFYLLQALGVLGSAYFQLRYPRLVESQIPQLILNLALTLLSRLLDGAVAWLLLRGVSLGLEMIVETDVNYRRNRGEVEHDD